MNEKFILVNWPESQQFMDCKNSYFCDDFKVESSTYFVIEDLYKLGKEHPNLYGKELEKLLEKEQK